MTARKLTREERIEREAEALYALNMFEYCEDRSPDKMTPCDRAAYRKLATRVIDQQDSREGPLRKVLRNVEAGVSPSHFNGVCRCKACQSHEVLAAHAALDAAPERTLVEAAEDALDVLTRGFDVSGEVAKNLRAALEREKGGR